MKVLSEPIQRYDSLAIAFHWALALGLAMSFGVGLYMTELSMSPARLKLYNWHKWAGVSILALSALRLFWRLRHPPPPEMPMPAWQQRVAHLGHAALYVLFFAVPLAGWAYSSAAGFPIVWFGVLPLPDFIHADRAVAETIKPVHAVLAYTLATLVALHVAAAVKHHFFDRDGLMFRMVPIRVRKPTR